MASDKTALLGNALTAEGATTAPHRLIGVAAVLGYCFVITHLITIVVTAAIAGFDVPISAFMLDIMGFLAGGFFAEQCRRSSNSTDRLKENRWIMIWAVITICSRVIDTLMLFGVIKWGDIYETPEGAILWSNLVSEVFFANSFTVTAFVGAMMLVNDEMQKN